MAKTNKKSKGKTKPTKDKKKIRVSEMFKRDRDACIVRDKMLAEDGIKKPTRDIYKDDPCYRCKWAVEKRDKNLGPFDRRFSCTGISRICHGLDYAKEIINKGELLHGQQIVLNTAMLIGRVVKEGTIACVSGNDKPSCFQGDSLSDFLAKE